MEKKVFKTGEIITPEFMNQLQDAVKETESEVSEHYGEFEELVTALMRVFTSNFDTYSVSKDGFTATLDGKGIQIGSSTGGLKIASNPPSIEFWSGYGGPRAKLTCDGLKLVKSSGTQAEKQTTLSIDDEGSLFLESSPENPRRFKVVGAGGNSAYAYVDYNKVVVLDGSGNVVIDKNGITITKRGGTAGSTSVSISYDGNFISFDKPVKADNGLYLSDNLRIIKENNGNDYFVFQRFFNNSWDEIARIYVSGQNYDRFKIGSWELGEGGYGAFVINGSKGVVLSSDYDKGDITIRNNLRVNGNFIMPKMICVTDLGSESEPALDLTQGDYADIDKYPNGSLICVWTYSSTRSYVKAFSVYGIYQLNSYSSMLFVKIEGTWRRVGGGS